MASGSSSARWRTSLLAHPDVADAAVTARPRPSGADKYLCGYYVPRRPVTGLRTYLQRLLPAHAVPAYLIELPELPLHASGKLDRSRLPEPAASQLVTGADYLAPRDELSSGCWWSWPSMRWHRRHRDAARPP